MTFRSADKTCVHRYRFGLRTADFILCRACGVYIAAVLTTARGRFATVNVNALDESLDVPEATPVSYDGESAGQRQRRRERSWTPVVDRACLAILSGRAHVIPSDLEDV